MKNFRDKVAVITGAASGLGKGLAEMCIRKNMKVVLADINPDTLSQTEAEFKKMSDSVVSIITDISREKDINELANKAIEAYGEVNLLFNNAGISGPLGPIWETDIKEFEKVIKCNLTSIAYSLKAFIPHMIKQGNECYIVNTASGAGLHTGPLMSGYMATKHAVVALSEVLFFDLQNAKANIGVSVLCPGLVATNFSNTLVEKSTDSQEIKERINFYKSAMKEQGKPVSEVVELVFDAIEKNQFYILTHLVDHAPMIRERMENILNTRNPINKKN